MERTGRDQLINIYARMHNPWTQTIVWGRPRGWGQGGRRQRGRKWGKCVIVKNNYKKNSPSWVVVQCLLYFSICVKSFLFQKNHN